MVTDLAGGEGLPVYLDLVMGLNFAVDFLLLLGTNQLSGYPAGAGRAALAAAVGGVYGGMCLVPGFRFLGSLLWRTVSLGVMGLIAFGLQKSTPRRCVLFVLLSMALGGVSLGLGSSDAMALIGAAGALCLLCLFGFRGQLGNRYVPIALNWGEQQLNLVALRDTGNTLRDPVSGERVIVAGVAAAQKLLGLGREQLAMPVETAASGTIPGLRLIPYRAVGQRSGLLLGIRVHDAKVAGVRQSVVLAFAPEGLDSENGEYDALIGGTV